MVVCSVHLRSSADEGFRFLAAGRWNMDVKGIYRQLLRQPKQLVNMNQRWSIYIYIHIQVCESVVTEVGVYVVIEVCPRNAASI